MELTCNCKIRLDLMFKPKFKINLVLVSNLFWKRDSQFNSPLGSSRCLWPSLSSTPNAAQGKPNGFSL